MIAKYFELLGKRSIILMRSQKSFTICRIVVEFKEDFYDLSRMLVHGETLLNRENCVAWKRRWTYQNEFLTGNIYASTIELRDEWEKLFYK